MTVTLGAVTNSIGLRTDTSARTLRWTPAATATNIAGTASSTTVATESGTADRDF